jgi:cytoskeletal protein CcmA (bactofilin family)
MRTWILGWLFLALTVICFTLFSAFAAERVSAQTLPPSPQPATTSAQLNSVPTFLSGSEIEVSQTPSGPVFVSGGRVRQSETVAGDLVIAAGSTVITGTVEQDVYVATGTLVIEGTVHGNVIVAAGEVLIAPGGRVDGSVIAFTQRLNMSGEIGSSLQVMAENVLLHGLVGDTATVQSQKLSLDDATRVNVLTGQVQEISETPSASVSSRSDFKVEPRQEESSQSAQKIFTHLMWGAAQGVFLACILWWCFRALWPGATAYLHSHLSAVLAWGFTVGLIWPAAALFLLATILGFPLMVLGTVVWLGFLWMGWVIPAIAVATQNSYLQSLPRWARVLLVGAAWGALMALPWVGWILRVGSGLIGLGLVSSLAHTRWSRPVKASSAK